MELRVLPSLSGVDRAAWDRLVGDELAFLEWDWLEALEVSDCVCPEAGWLPRHLSLWEGDELVAACPTYVKGNSMGEFVFDHSWADAAERAGLRYYPKLLVGTPFTPATGQRFLVAPGRERAPLVRALGSALIDFARQGGFSSVHVNFCTESEVQELETVGYARRAGYQFQWFRLPEWRTFEDYLGSLRSKRRNQVRRERRAPAEQGIEIEVRRGEQFRDGDARLLYDLYRTTVDKFFWGKRYLTPELFERLLQTWRHRIVAVLAKRGDEVVAGAINVRKGAVLYGRYWGAFEEVRHLHFNVCYYAAIEYCLREGIDRFEPGAGGEFKQLRGFDPRPTVSAHWVAHEGLAAAIEEFLSRERRGVEDVIGVYQEQTAFRRDGGGA